MHLFGHRTLGFACAALAGVFFAAGAQAENLSNTPWSFTAAFPCQSQMTSTPVATNMGNVTLVAYFCQQDQLAYFVGVTDYAKGALTGQNVDAVYDGAVQGAATNFKGTIRSAVPYTSSNVTGRDALVDDAADHLTAHARFFVVGDRLYQVLAVVPTGDENGQVTLDFLNSFALQP
jgi:hypothetical protein